MAPPRTPSASASPRRPSSSPTSARPSRRPPPPSGGPSQRAATAGPSRRALEAPQPVADPAHGLEGRRAVGQLAAQAGYGDLDDVGAARPLVAPDVAQERLARHGPALALAQVAQDLALELGQRDAAAVEHQLARVSVQPRLLHGG